MSAGYAGVVDGVDGTRGEGVVGSYWVSGLALSRAAAGDADGWRSDKVLATNVRRWRGQRKR